MRFLHTSDWHLGKTLRARTRDDEHEAVLAEIIDIASREKIDCVLVSGDVFDSQAPPPEAERLAFKFFLELRGLNIPAVVIGGNHDHPKRLLAIKGLLQVLDIHVCPEPARPADGGVVQVKTKTEGANIAVLPFVSIGKVEDAAKLMGPEIERYQEYSGTIGAMCEALTQSFSAKTINILMAHLYVFGAQTSKSEREVHVAKPYAVSGQVFPASANYVALGHLHRPQEIAAPSQALYAGSTLQLDFGEQDQEKRVVIIDARPGKPSSIQSYKLASGRKLMDAAGTLEDLKTASGKFGNAFLRVTVKLDGPTPGIPDKVHEILPNALEVRLDYPRIDKPAPAIAGLEPQDIFRQYYATEKGAGPPEKVSQLFNTLYEEAVNAAD
ncbi:MAG TPA: exonuclease SbcCD subunit D [Blastocatellia bacterium]|nr:exonuclease SbcCD subunit D [Blastocatellia bacterium]